MDNAVYVDGRRVAEPTSLQLTYDLLRDTNGMAWIGLYRPQVAEMRSVAAEFELHGLAVEDTIASPDGGFVRAVADGSGGGAVRDLGRGGRRLRLVVAGLENDIDEVEGQVFAEDPTVSRRVYELLREVIEFQRATQPLVGMLDQLTTGFAKYHVEEELQR